MKAARTDRSLLFVPGHRPDRFDKAAASGAHALVLDLEDAVAPDDKLQARTEVAAWLAAGRVAFVRVNAADTPWHADDLRMLAAAPKAGVMLPKADAAHMAAVLQALPGRRAIALLESVAGYQELAWLAAVPGLERIAFGSVDFAAETGIADEGEALTAVRTQIVLQSLAAGLAPPIDSVSLGFTDAEALLAEARRSRALGFGGKLCIHPAQLAAVHAAFAPTAAEQAWAARVLAAFEASGGAATAVDGKMVDKPVVERARRLLAEPAAAAL
ncbi:CoA ester lyase [Pseudorhodoferax sp. LjRoot39]|uniref:HpcH/HpaI aldolase/citrate lyase family protein n=1 Tax=Pseudorhodoferax sp. LjRoot39 TaxID=3342328 RepID=UPI003ECC88A4